MHRPSPTRSRRAFTLIELLVVIGIIAILAIVAFIVINPSQLLAQARDSNRIADMSSLSIALADYQSLAHGSLGTAGTIYVSVPDPTASLITGNQCQGLGLQPPPAGYAYHCVAPSTDKDIDGTGWIPASINALLPLPPVSVLPLDPTNTTSSRLYYMYISSGTQYEVTAAMESAKYKMGGSNDVVTTDGGQLASSYEKGSGYGLEPMDMGDASLVGYWSLNEGTGTVAYDYSGTNATGSWSGTQIGTVGTYYTAGQVRPYAGDFDGSTDWISRPHTATYDFGTGDFSVAFWIDPQGKWTTTYTEGIIGQKTNDTSPGFQIYHDSGDTTKIRFRLGDGTGNGNDVSSTVGSVPIGQWTFCVAERQSGVTSLYINGALNSSAANSKNISGGTTSTLNIGFGNTWPSSYFQGYLDDIRIYSRALSAAEIAGLYNGQK